jgi:mRNA degradation ribonuclease J1/J2
MSWVEKVSGVSIPILNNYCWIKAKTLEFKDTSTKINNVQAIQIDHSTIPSFMYLIQEGDERLVYTGDFRGQIFSPDKGQLPTKKAITILKK